MFVSVVVIAKNEESNLFACLESLKNQNFDRSNYEVIVIDNNSTDRTAEIAKAFEAEHAGFKLYLNPVPGTAPSRNMGLDKARFPLVAFVDADCVAKIEWLTSLIQAFEDFSALDVRCAGVGGPNILPAKANRFRRSVEIATSTFWGSSGSVQASSPLQSSSVEHLPTLNVLYRTSVIRELGGFDEDQGGVGEDLELSCRIIGAGYSLYYTPNAVVYHEWRTDIIEWVFTMFGYGKARIWVIKKHPKSAKIVHIFPVALLIATVLSLFPPFYLLATVPLFYLCLSFGFATIASYRAGQGRFIFDVSLVFIATHYSYSLGQIYGIIHSRSKVQ